MNISPEVAAKILEANLRNIVKKVSDGGTLSPSERKMLNEKTTGFAAAAVPPSVVAANPEPEPEPVSDTRFTLKPEPPKLTGADQARYSKQYGKGWRTIFRWVQMGEKKGDPCPLADATQMPAWWDRNMTWRCPPEIEKAASEARASAPPPPPPPNPEPSQSPPPPASSPLPSQPPTAGPKFNLEDFDPEDGDRLRELKQIQAVRFKELKDAIEERRDTTLLEGKYLKLYETIDKIETRALERLKKQGIYILRAEVDADLAANAEMLRQSQESMERRVLELCTSLTGEQRTEVAAAIRRARSAEEKTLCRLNVLTPDELSLELAS